MLGTYVSLRGGSAESRAQRSSSVTSHGVSRNKRVCSVCTQEKHTVGAPPGSTQQAEDMGMERWAGGKGPKRVTP